MRQYSPTQVDHYIAQSTGTDTESHKQCDLVKQTLAKVYYVSMDYIKHLKRISVSLFTTK